MWEQHKMIQKFDSKEISREFRKIDEIKQIKLYWNIRVKRICIN